MLQLTSDRCGVILPKKRNEVEVVTVASIKDRLGVGPGQVASLFALTEKNGRDSVLTQRQAVRFLQLHGTQRSYAPPNFMEHLSLLRGHFSEHGQIRILSQQ